MKIYNAFSLVKRISIDNINDCAILTHYFLGRRLTPSLSMLPFSMFDAHSNFSSPVISIHYIVYDIWNFFALGNSLWQHFPYWAFLFLCIMGELLPFDAATACYVLVKYLLLVNWGSAIWGSHAIKVAIFAMVFI